MNLIQIVITYPRFKDTTKVYNAVNSISHREEFVNACLDLPLNKCECGIYNVTNGGYVTTKQVVECMKRSLSWKKNLNIGKMIRSFIAKEQTPPRSNCVMDNSKLLNTESKCVIAWMQLKIRLTNGLRSKVCQYITNINVFCTYSKKVQHRQYTELWWKV